MKPPIPNNRCHLRHDNTRASTSRCFFVEPVPPFWPFSPGGVGCGVTVAALAGQNGRDRFLDGPNVSPFLDPERCHDTHTSPPKRALARIRAGRHPAFLAYHVFHPCRFRLCSCTTYPSHPLRCLAYSHISRHRLIPSPVISLLPENLYISFLAASVRRLIDSFCRPRIGLARLPCRPAATRPDLHHSRKKETTVVPVAFRTTRVFGSDKIRYVTARRRVTF